MASTVYLDGQEQLNINGSAAAQIVTASASGNITIQTDGDAEVIITADAGAAVSIVEDGELGLVTETHTADMPWYTGDTAIPPTTQMQPLQPAGKAIANNIIINPIPNNYGLITWNGLTLTVS